MTWKFETQQNRQNRQRFSKVGKFVEALIIDQLMVSEGVTAGAQIIIIIIIIIIIHKLNYTEKSLIIIHSLYSTALPKDPAALYNNDIN